MLQSTAYLDPRRPDGAIRFRAPVPDDAVGVHAVIRARDVADLGAPDYTLEDLRDRWNRSDLHLDVDALIAQADNGQIIAYADVQRRGTFAVVAPNHERQGIGTRLLHWAQARERQRGHERHRQFVAAGNARARALLGVAGYQRARSYWRMALPLDHVADIPRPPVGVRLRPLDVARDATALHALDAASFAGHPDYQPASLPAFCVQELHAHDLDADTSRVAEHGRSIIGFVLARRWQTRSIGYLALLAVHPNHQRHGVGTALLRTAFARFAAAGLREAQLAVASDNARALRLYEQFGMKSQFHFDIYERPLINPSAL
jgi:mycothiol synthase